MDDPSVPGNALNRIERRSLQACGHDEWAAQAKKVGIPHRNKSAYAVLWAMCSDVQSDARACRVRTD
jgi:hypothetical protein